MTTIAHRTTGGVDTHLDTHVAAALDERGAQLGVQSFAATKGCSTSTPSKDGLIPSGAVCLSARWSQPLQPFEGRHEGSTVQGNRATKISTFFCHPSSRGPLSLVT